MDSPILFLHGALGTGSSFRKQTEKLEGGPLFFAPDLPGHGKGPEGGKLSTESLADYVLGWMEDRNYRKVSIFGHSLGGYIGLYLAAHYPDKIQRVFTFGTKMNWTPEFASQSAAALDPDNIQNKNEKLAAYLSSSHPDWKTLTRAVGSYMKDLGRSPSLDESVLSLIKCPVRMSVGDRDHMVTIDETLRSYKALSSGQMQVFPGTGHDIEKLSPDLFIEAWNHFSRVPLPGN